MKDFNRIVISGRLVAEPTVRWSNGSSPIAIADMRIANNRGKDKDPYYINCTAFRQTAENIDKLISSNKMGKGDYIFIDGELQVIPYTKKDGSKTYLSSIIINEFRLESKKNSNETKVNTDSRSESEHAIRDPFNPEEY